MTPLERFDAWIAGGKAPGMSYSQADYLAIKLLHTQAEISEAISQIRHWLAKNEDTGKANKRLWGRFMLTWLSPKSSRQGRLEPSNFD